jgi:hypothetical protein
MAGEESLPSQPGAGRLRPSSRIARVLADHPLSLGAVVCVVLGGVSVAVLPSLPGYDAFAWVVWGRELAHLIVGRHDVFVVGGGPSWKPLPVAFTTVFGFFGAAPKLWVATARAGGLFGLFVGYRLAWQLAASSRWRLAGPIAGSVAVLALFLTSQWTHNMFRGVSEPLVVAATLLAVERHLAGHRTAAFFSGVALALLRPEAAIFVFAYAAWLSFADPRPKTWVILLLGLLAVPAGWLVPPWIAAGNALQASMHARAFHGNLGVHPLLEVLKRATNLTVWPVIIAGGALTLMAIRTRDWFIVALAAMTMAYVLVVEIMTLAGYPGLERFLLPAASVACVLAGVAVARFAGLAGGGWLSLGAAAVLVAVSVPFFAGRVAEAGTERHMTQQAVDIYDQLHSAVGKAAALGTLFPCPKSFAAVNHTVQTSLAWSLDVPLTHVLTVTYVNSSLRRPALAFFAPRNPITGGAPTKFVHRLRGQLVTHAGIWKVFRVTRLGDRRADACVGPLARRAR